MLPTDIHHVFLPDGRRAGRFLTHDGHVHHLEDYYGLLDKEIPPGVIDDYTLAKIGHPGNGLKIASHGAMRNGHANEFLPEAKLEALPPQGTPTGPHVEVKPPSVWHYHRHGHDQPHLLEHHEGTFLLDGNPLQPDEVSTILDNVRTKAGKLRYAKPTVGSAVAKMEQHFASLRKDDNMSPDDALAHLDQIGSDDKTKAAIATLRRHVFEDQMNPGVGNKFAYEQFRAKNQPGVWTSMDVNDLKHLNDTQGHDAGDALIRGFGAAARAAVDPTAGKLFRPGGDEYVMWHPTPEAAHLALRNIRSRVDEVPPVNGTHRISFSAGIGHDFQTADKALFQAKAQKIHPETGQRAFAPGATPHFAHSLLPGSEGPIPLSSDQVAPEPPKLPEPASVALAPTKVA